MTRSRVFLQADKDWREAVLDRDPLCVACRAEGLTVAAEEADHIVPLHRGGARYDLANGEGLCKAHHSKKTAGESARRRGRMGHDERGYPLARLR